MRQLLVLLFIVFACLVCAPILQAQPDEVEFDEDMTDFRDKQELIQKLILKQSFALQRLTERVDINERAQQQITKHLSYPKNLKACRDSCLKVVENIRKRNDELLLELQGMYYEWFRHQQDLLSIYARFGELRLADRINDELKQFLLAYRKHMDLMYKQADRVEFIYKECDFLLSAKLK